MIISNKLTKLSVVWFAALAVFGGRVQAAQTPSGITVSPAFQQVSVSQAVTKQPVTFTITNDKTTAQSFTLSVADFNTLNESGGLFFVGTNPTDLQKKYGLASWISLPVKSLTLAPKQTTKIQASILNLPTLQGGGHYGALMIALDSGNNSNGANQVGLHPIASSLLFVTKLSGATYDLSLSGVTYKHSLFKLPDSVNLRFQNLGNTHLTPRGSVTISDSKGKTVSKGVLNENSGIILPQAFRQYKVDLRNVSTSKPYGNYKIALAYRFDGFNQFRTYQSTINLFPIALIIVIIIITVGLIILALSKEWPKLGHRIFRRKRT
jgi:hypothetical protein